ncbi:MAG: chitobiase/beta-hexosaminidase C-terminal domain-containing protein [Roseburia sp.]|nr:chitobiase/beta-hexosaminidase C-terminal domain-containing protein [Roseburia sp.]
MICSKCGAQIPKGKIYCNVCGADVQLVPDYNFLEDDMLSDIVSRGVNGTEENADQTESKEEDNNRKTNYKYVFIWGALLLLVAASAIALACVHDQIKRQQDNSYDYQYSLGEEYQDMEEPGNAIYYFQRAWDLLPEDTNAPYKIVDIYLAQGKENEAVSVINQVVEIHGYDKESCQKLIDIYDGQGNYQKIRELCEEVRGSVLLDLFEDYLVEQPSFSRISGTYTDDQKIELISSKGYEIYYTTDGSDPTVSGVLYRGELNLKNGTSLVQAATKSPKGIYSEVVKAMYTIRKE